jgi:hypothetical protein
MTNTSKIQFTTETYFAERKHCRQRWASDHDDAVSGNGRSADEQRMMGLIESVHAAAVAFPACGFGLPEVLLPMIQAARAALNFETGRLDCGTLDRGLVGLARALGIQDEDL